MEKDTNANSDIRPSAGEAVPRQVEPADRKPVSGFSPGEFAIVIKFLTDFALQAGRPGFRGYYEFGQDVNAYVVTFVGWLPLLWESANKLGKPLVFVTADGEMQTQARRYLVSLLIFDAPKLLLWRDLVTIEQTQPEVYRNLYIVGDLDFGLWKYEHRLIESYGRIANYQVLQLVNRLSKNPSAHVVLFHRKGSPSGFDLPTLARNSAKEASAKPNFWGKLLGR